MEGVGILPAVMPGKNASIRHDRLRKALVHEVVAEVDAMTHPLVRDAAGELLVETKFEVKLPIERSVRLVHQPSTPVRIRFADHLHFGSPAPAGTVIVPLNLIFADFAENTGADQVAHRNLIRFATMLSTNLNDEILSMNGIARRLHLFEHVAHGLFAIGILA